MLLGRSVPSFAVRLHPTSACRPGTGSLALSRRNTRRHRTTRVRATTVTRTSTTMVDLTDTYSGSTSVNDRTTFAVNCVSGWLSPSLLMRAFSVSSKRDIPSSNSPLEMREMA